MEQQQEAAEEWSAAWNEASRTGSSDAVAGVLVGDVSAEVMNHRIVAYFDNECAEPALFIAVWKQLQRNLSLRF